MKDIFGNELEVGDTVAFMEPGYAYALNKGTVVKLTPQKLKIEWKYKIGDQECSENTYKFPVQVAKKINGET